MGVAFTKNERKETLAVDVLRDRNVHRIEKSCIEIYGCCERVYTLIVVYIIRMPD